MSVFFRPQQRTWAGLKAENLFGRSWGMRTTGSVVVTPDSALRSSAVWACLRLRADLISTLPVDAFRRLPDGTQVEVAKPIILTQPGGARVGITEWLYSSQFELDRTGNSFGIIRERTAAGYPARIDLVETGDVVVRGVGSEVTEYRIGSSTYAPRDIWHERQFTVPGMAMGLSPVAYAAWSVGGYLSAQQFALNWFAADANPAGILRNTTQATVAPDVADAAKQRFKAAVSGRDVFVTGSDWEYTAASADASQAAFLEQMHFGVTDVSRFFGVPADLIDGVQGKGGNITYANVTQRNLQLLVLNLGPAIIRREAALTSALPRPQYVKFATDAILRLDPAARNESILAPSEARELDNLPPLTSEQLDEFNHLPSATPNHGAPA